MTTALILQAQKMKKQARKQANNKTGTMKQPQGTPQQQSQGYSFLTTVLSRTIVRASNKRSRAGREVVGVVRCKDSNLEDTLSLTHNIITKRLHYNILFAVHRERGERLN